MLRRLPTFLLVTLVTLLIWAFAEAETLVKREATVDLVIAGDAEVAITVLEPVPDAATEGARRQSPGREEVVRVVASLEGAAASIDEAERLLRSPLRLTSLPRDAGDHSIDLRAAIREHPSIKGVSVTKVTPAAILIATDPLTSREVPVRVVLGEGESAPAVAGTPEARPSKARLILPTRVAQYLPADAACIATPESSSLERLVSGRQETIAGVRLSPPRELAGEMNVRIDPPRADIVVTLKSKLSTAVLPSVPVHLQIPPGELPNWDIKVEQKDRFITDVTVTGPADLVKAVQDKTTPVFAVLVLSYTELEKGGAISKEVVFSGAPAGLKFEAADRVVTATVTRR